MTSPTLDMVSIYITIPPLRMEYGWNSWEARTWKARNCYDGAQEQANINNVYRNNQQFEP